MSTALTLRPRFGQEEAARLARELYGLEGRARELPSERDQNFLLVTDGASYVLKIAAAAEPPAVLDLQNKALEWLAAHAPSLPFPRVCATPSGTLTTTVQSSDGSTQHVRMLTYLPGTVLAEVNPQTPGLLRNLDRRAAAEFSFILSAPIIVGAACMKAIHLVRHPHLERADLIMFAVGVFASATAGFLCIKYFLRYLQSKSFLPFVLYRIVLGVTILTLNFWFR